MVIKRLLLPILLISKDEIVSLRACLSFFSNIRIVRIRYVGDDRHRHHDRHDHDIRYFLRSHNLRLLRNRTMMTWRYGCMPLAVAAAAAVHVVDVDNDDVYGHNILLPKPSRP